MLNRAAWLAAPSVPISQAELGAIANASRKQVNAALAQFGERGWRASQARTLSFLCAA